MAGHLIPMGGSIALVVLVCLPSYVVGVTTDENAQTRHPFRGKSSDATHSGHSIADRIGESIKKPCAIVVLSNAQNPYMHSLLRKYRYDAKGVLIPSSVRYFVKLPNGLESSTELVPLHDKAFSPLGGFVRYYKEVPPIPQSW